MTPIPIPIPQAKIPSYTSHINKLKLKQHHLLLHLRLLLRRSMNKNTINNSCSNQCNNNKNINPPQWRSLIPPRRRIWWNKSHNLSRRRSHCRGGSPGRDEFLPPPSPEHSGLLVSELGLRGEPFRSLPRGSFMVQQPHQTSNLLFLHFCPPQNAERLALALCRMRGAALKLGQMLSLQDESLVPAPILAALDIVRQGAADVMPRKQLNQVLDAELGPDWQSKLISFDYVPLASASIGQVHRAVTKDGMDVAMKIQYPGVADSIESDIDNVKVLLALKEL